MKSPEPLAAVMVVALVFLFVGVTQPAAPTPTLSESEQGGQLSAAQAQETARATAPASEATVTELPQLVGEVPAQLPEGPLGEWVALGQDIVANTDTHPLSAEYVGNRMSCSSCHLQSGQDPQGGTFVGVASAYPAFAPREDKIITLDDRIANCYMRSMNGTRPPTDEPAVAAITAYITWLSQGVPMEMNAKASLGPNRVTPLALEAEAANPERGAEIYTASCADCHGADGQGSDAIAPLWGPQSYNAGAGMSNDVKLASWVKVSMPLGNPTLTEQEALDVTAFINSHSRPEFVLEKHLGQ